MAAGCCFSGSSPELGWGSELELHQTPPPCLPRCLPSLPSATTYCQLQHQLQFWPYSGSLHKVHDGSNPSCPSSTTQPGSSRCRRGSSGSGPCPGPRSEPGPELLLPPPLLLLPYALCPGPELELELWLRVSSSREKGWQVLGGGR